MSKTLGKRAFIETKGWRHRAALKIKQRRINRRREDKSWKQASEN